MQIYEGVFKSWKSESGFGFIQPIDGGKDIFIHIKDLKHANYQPKLGDAVKFEIGMDKNGKSRAMNAYVIGQEIVTGRNRSQVNKPNNQTSNLFTWIIAAIPFILTSYIMLSPDVRFQNIICQTGYALFFDAKHVCISPKAIQKFTPFGIYLSLSLVTFIIYAIDKIKAQKDEWRIPEKTIHSLELLGGWPGALLAQRFLRHKNKKTSFQVVFWMIAVTHILLLTDIVLFKSAGMHAIICQLQLACK